MFRRNRDLNHSDFLNGVFANVRAAMSKPRRASVLSRVPRRVPAVTVRLAPRGPWRGRR